MRGSKRMQEIWYRYYYFDQPLLLHICGLPLSWLVALAWCQVLRTMDISGCSSSTVEAGHQCIPLAAFGVEKASSTGEGDAIQCEIAAAGPSDQHMGLATS
ncbi:hypothetical protein BC835DRAFT_1395754 [Cytidiella melzeri]|nr:hypothetical protein BC835DRAFT_1395754 [Cytidiella melzeri]